MKKYKLGLVFILMAVFLFPSAKVEAANKFRIGDEVKIFNGTFWAKKTEVIVNGPYNVNVKDRLAPGEQLDPSLFACFHFRADGTYTGWQISSFGGYGQTVPEEGGIEKVNDKQAQALIQYQSIYGSPECPNKSDISGAQIGTLQSLSPGTMSSIPGCYLDIGNAISVVDGRSCADAKPYNISNGQTSGTFKVGDVVEILQDLACSDYNLQGTEDKVIGDDCKPLVWPAAYYYFGGVKGTIKAGPTVNPTIVRGSLTEINSSGFPPLAGKVAYQIDIGDKDYSLPPQNPDYGKRPVYYWTPESMLSNPNTPKQTVGSVALTSDKTLMKNGETIHLIAKILDTEGKPMRGYTLKWSHQKSQGVRCSLYGEKNMAVAGATTASPSCADPYFDGSINSINAPARTIIFTATSGGKSASVTIYLSYRGDKGASGAIPPGPTNPPPSTPPTTPPPSNVPGCQAGFMFSPTTGAPCSGGSNVPGCQPGFAFSSTSGQPCNGSGGGGATGGTPAACTNNGTGPSVTLCANSTSVRPGSSVILKWTSTGLTGGSCSVKNQAGVSIGRSQLETSNNSGLSTGTLSSGTHTFTITCESGTSFVRDSEVVTVSNTAPVAPVENPLPPVSLITTGFQMGANVRVKDEVTLNVRSDAGTSFQILGKQSEGSIGTIINVPSKIANGLTWWKVDYATGVDGWSAENYLMLSISSGGGGGTFDPMLKFTSNGQVVNSGLVVAAGSRPSVNVSVVNPSGAESTPASCQWTVPTNSIFQTQVYTGGLGASFGTSATSGTIIAKVQCGSASGELKISAAATTLPGGVWSGYVSQLNPDERDFDGTNENDCTNVWCVQYVQARNSSGSETTTCEGLIHDGLYPDNVGGYGDCLADASGHGENSEEYLCEVSKKQCEESSSSPTALSASQCEAIFGDDLDEECPAEKIWWQKGTCAQYPNQVGCN